MKKCTYFLIIFITCFCYSMEEKFKIQPIHNPDELIEGLRLAGLMYDTIFANDAILTPEEKAWVEEYRKTKPQKLLAISGRKDAFVMENNEIAGFIASHLDEKKPTRIILDSIYLGQEKPNIETIPLILGYITTKYSQAIQFWAAILKKNESGSQFLKSQGFTLSKYMDALHNPDIFQGWKREIKR